MLCHQVCQTPRTSSLCLLVPARNADIKVRYKRSEKACGLRDENQIPVSLDRQALGGSLEAEAQSGHGTYDRPPPLGGQADGEPEIQDQSFLDSDQDFTQAPSSITQMETTDSYQHDGWESLPSLVNSDPIGHGPYLQVPPYAQALAAATPGLNGAAAAAAPDSNIETNNDFTDWRVTT